MNKRVNLLKNMFFILVLLGIFLFSLGKVSFGPSLANAAPVITQSGVQLLFGEFSGITQVKVCFPDGGKIIPSYDPGISLGLEKAFLQ